jgi:hypothetical protein
MPEGAAAEAAEMSAEMVSAEPIGEIAAPMPAQEKPYEPAIASAPIPAPVTEPAPVKPVAEAAPPMPKPTPMEMPMQMPMDLFQIETDPNKAKEAVSTEMEVPPAPTRPRRPQVVTAPAESEPLVQIETHNK